MAPPSIDVLVVGAGPTGLNLACELSRWGIRHRLIEELPAQATISKAAGVHARTMEMWDSMGVASAVAAQSRLVRGINVFSGGKRVVHVPIDGLDSPYPHVYGISQREVERLLTEHLGKLGGSIERSRALQSFTQDADGVTATVSPGEGSSQPPEVIHARWLVGCDGAHSRVRHGLGFDFPGASYEERLIQADVKVQLPLEGVDDEIVVVLCERSLLALFPLFKDGRYRLVLLGGPEGEVDNPTLGVFQKALDEKLPGARATDPAWMVSFHIHHRHVDRYQDRRVFIAGDACHIHSPVGGQGMNTGMQDAFNLAWKLALVVKGSASPELLRTYGEERLPIARDLVGRTDLAMSALETATGMRNPLTVAVRNTLMSFFGGLSYVQSRATRTISMIEQNYRSSALSQQDRGRMWELVGLGDWAAFGDGPMPGDRAPDSPLVDSSGGASSIHALLRKPRFQVLVFTGPGADHPAPPPSPSSGEADTEVTWIVAGNSPPTGLPAGAHFLFDPQGQAYRRYGARSECLYVLRPDGYVGYRSSSADVGQASAYVQRVLSMKPKGAGAAPS